VSFSPETQRNSKIGNVFRNKNLKIVTHVIGSVSSGDAVALVFDSPLSASATLMKLD
jgi:hypothetical protein